MVFCFLQTFKIANDFKTFCAFISLSALEHNVKVKRGCSYKRFFGLPVC